MKKIDAEQFGTLVWLYHQSYLGVINVRLENLDALVEAINRLRRKKRPDFRLEKSKVEYSEEYLYLEYLSDALEKLGFLFYAKDKVKKHIKDLHVCKYHVYNSIFDCKALLDTMSGLLNHHYKLEKRRGCIDIKHIDFINALATKNPQLTIEIRKFGIWVKAITEWRDALIHRHGIPLLLVKNNKHFMPIKPKRFLEIALFQVPTVDLIEFCEENTKCAKSITEIVFRHLQNDLMARLSN